MLDVAIACGRFFDGFSLSPFTVHFMPRTGYIRRNGLEQKRKCCGLMLSGDRKRTRIRSAVKPGLESPGASSRAVSKKSTPTARSNPLA